MKYRFSSVVAMILLGAGLGIQLPAPGAERGAGVQSPEVLRDGRVTFRLKAPKAESVKLTGDLLKAREELGMQRGEEGMWSLTVGPLQPDDYTYRFIVDGVRMLDPSNPRIKLNERATSSMVSVGIEGLLHEARRVPHGTVSVRWYWSNTLGTNRAVRIYTPPGYDAASGRYPVLCLFHGTSDFESAWTRVGRANFILDNLIAEGKARPMIIVMPYGRAYPKVKLGDGSLGYWRNIQLFQEDLFNDLIPMVEKNYRVLANRENRAIAGLSGGGGEALTIGLGNMDRFAWVAGFSAAIREKEFDRNFAAAKNDPEQTNKALKLLWIGCGEDDHLFQANLAFVAWLKKHGVEHVYKQTTGGHTWINWRRYLAEIAPMLFR